MPLLSIVAVIGALFTLAQGVTPAQAPAPTGLILGRVVEADSGAPLSGVAVQIGLPVVTPGPSPIAPQPVVLTDAQGRFVFRNLPKGSYTISAVVGGTGYSPSGFLVSGLGHQIGAYLNGGYGQLRPNGPTGAIELA